MLVRTSSPGPQGLSVLLVPLKGTEGLTLRRLNMTGAHSSSTTFIDVKVPTENLLGKKGEGVKYVMVRVRKYRLVGIVLLTCLCNRQISSTNA